MIESGGGSIDVATLLAWVNQPSWAESESFLTSHPDLISDRAVAELHRQALVQPRATLVLMVDDHAWLLRLCQKQGVTAGYSTYQRLVEQSRRHGPEAEQAELRYTIAADSAALDRALEIRREIDELVAGTSRSRVRAARLDLGRLLLRRYQRDGTHADLDEAVLVVTSAWRIPGAVPRTQAAVTELLARSLRMRFELTREESDLEQALAILGEALEALPEDSSTLPGLLGAHGEALRLRYAVTGDRADLESSIAEFTRAEAWIGEVLARRPARLGDLGTGIMERYGLTNAREDLDRAIAAFDGAVAGTPAGSPDRVAHVINLGTALLLRHDRTGDADDLDRSRALLEEADARLGPESPLRPVMHGVLSTFLRTLYGRTGDAACLDRSVEHAEAAVEASPTGAVPATRFVQLGNILLSRAQRGAELPPGDHPSDVGDLDRAVACYENAIAATPLGAPGRPERMASLAIGLAERYLRTGAVADLDRAIEMLQSSLRDPPSGALNEAGNRLNLGNVLWIRYGRTRRLDDLDETLDALRRAAGAMPQGSTDRPSCLNSLAVAFSERYGRTDRFEDLAECVRLLREAATSAPPTGTNHAVISANLGNALRKQARVIASTELREESVAVLRSALETATRDGMPRAGLCHNLASALLSAVDTPPTRQEVDQAIGLLETALALTPKDTIDAPQYRASLGRALRIRFRLTADPDDLRRGLEHLHAASNAALETDLELAVNTARLCAEWAVQERNPPVATEAFRTALTAVHRLIEEQATRPQKETWLRQAEDVHMHAAHAFLCEPTVGARDAVVALEQGRALLLAEALDLRAADLDRLREDYPALAARYMAKAGLVGSLLTASLSRPALHLPETR